MTPAAVARFLGYLRSIAIYHAIPRRQARLRRLYARFVSPGDLAFDVGAHAGNRSRALRALGCRVVAIEPHPDFARLLRGLFARASEVTVVESAVAETVGRTPLAVSDLTPTLSTLDSDWRSLREREARFARIRWNRTVDVATTTLDALIVQYGVPAFIKIDVEGAEPRVLAGLTHPLPAVSFEYLPTALESVLTCVQHLTRLGPYRFNWSVGESYRLAAPLWLNDAELCAALDAPPRSLQSGDIYALLASEPDG